MRLTFEEGTLLLSDYDGDDAPPAFIWDARVDLYRAGLTRGRPHRLSYPARPQQTALSNQVLTDDLASISIAVGDLFTDDDGDGLS